MRFETAVGPISAEVLGRRVKVMLTDPKHLKINIQLEKLLDWESVDFINTGVPHVVIRVKDLENIPIKEVGRKIRFHEIFSPEGTNVNFMKRMKDNLIEVRTYERGVEDETLACGTGSIASALISSLRDGNSSPVDVKTKGGEILRIYFKRQGDRFFDIWLEGDTNIVYKGELHEEALL
ncbi:MAG: diaminopimelate epimerase [Deltaproteobacteria bacterium]|nr:MAG: diaminopimelate epimerase [Deltaproteobacteria bacterium]